MTNEERYLLSQEFPKLAHMGVSYGTVPLYGSIMRLPCKNCSSRLEEQGAHPATDAVPYQAEHVEMKTYCLSEDLGGGKSKKIRVAIGQCDDCGSVQTAIIKERQGVV